MASSNRDPLISLRISEEDLALVDANAEDAGLSRTAYLLAQAREPGAGKRLKMSQRVQRVWGQLLELAGELDAALREDEAKPARRTRR